jgi:hypothetical protein
VLGPPSIKPKQLLYRATRCNLGNALNLAEIVVHGSHAARASVHAPQFQLSIASDCACNCVMHDVYLFSPISPCNAYHMATWMAIDAPNTTEFSKIARDCARTLVHHRPSYLNVLTESLLLLQFCTCALYIYIYLRSSWSYLWVRPCANLPSS